MFYSTLGSMDTGMSMTHKGGTSNFSLGGVSYNTDTLHTHTHIVEENLSSFRI